MSNEVEGELERSLCDSGHTGILWIMTYTVTKKNDKTGELDNETQESRSYKEDSKYYRESIEEELSSSSFMIRRTKIISTKGTANA